MLERMILAGIQRYHNKLRASGMEPESSARGEIAYAEDGLRGLLAMYYGEELERARNLEGYKSDADVPADVVRKYLVEDAIYGLEVVLGLRTPADAGWWDGRMEPAPARSPNRLENGEAAI